MQRACPTNMGKRFYNSRNPYHYIKEEKRMCENTTGGSPVYPLSVFDYVVLFRMGDKIFHAFFNNTADACEFVYSEEFGNLEDRVLFKVFRRMEKSVVVMVYDDEGRVMLGSQTEIMLNADLNLLMGKVEELKNGRS